MKNRIKEARKYAQSFKSDFTKEDDIVLFFERIEAFTEMAGEIAVKM